MKTSLLVLSLLASSSLVAGHYGDDYEKVGTKSLSLEAATLNRLSIEAGAGSLKVIGGEQEDIKVSAEIYQKDLGANYCLSLEEDDSKAKLIANTCHSNNEMLIHLTVNVPQTLLTKIKDSSGFIEINNASVDYIKDSSGYIEISTNHSALTVKDGSGAISINDNQGDVTIHDGSGAIEIGTIAGNISVNDGSGKISIDSVTGDVEVEDGSGSISVSNANSFKLISDGSGKVSLNNVNSQKE